MPLIIAVLIIIVLIVSTNDSIKENLLRNANFAHDGRKTNAILEQRLVDQHMKEGMNLHEAIDVAKTELIKAGFEPCIPSGAYGTNRYGKNLLFENEETSYVENPSRFDSKAVKMRRETLKNMGLSNSDNNVYDKFPRNYSEYSVDLKRASLGYQIIKKGGWFTHPKYGTCEVIDYSYGLNKTSGYYIARVISTDKIVRDIKIGDKQIRIIK